MPKAEPVAVPIQKLQAPSAHPCEQVETAIERIVAQAVTDQDGQAVDLFAHVGVPRTKEGLQLAPVVDHGDLKADTSLASRTAVQRPGTDRRTSDGKSI